MDKPDLKAASVSVIIPSYNCAAYIEEAIESVLIQSLRPVEVIVVDDGSTDNTVEVMQPFLDHVEYLPQSNQGVSVARNVGLARAQCEYVAFLDADDAWYSEKLELQIEFLTAHPNVAAVFSDFATTGENGKVHYGCSVKKEYPIFDNYGLDWTDIFAEREEFASYSATAGHDDRLLAAFWGNAFSSLYLGNFINTSSVLLKRDVLADVGGFTPARRTQEDYELWLKVALRYPLGFIDIPLLLRRLRANQLTSHSEARNIIQVSLEVIEEFAPLAREALGDNTVNKRLSDKYRHLALAQLGQDDRKSARYNLRRSLRHRWTFFSLLLYLWSYLPDSIEARIRSLVRGSEGGGR
jgi:glycosyltransferase involved in cell wall biosynthesis